MTRRSRSKGVQEETLVAAKWASLRLVQVTVGCVSAAKTRAAATTVIAMTATTAVETAMTAIAVETTAGETTATVGVVDVSKVSGGSY